MGHTNSTTNYSLPQFIGTDKPAWLTDVNQAMSAIDTAIKGAANDASAASTAAGNASTAAGNAQSTATAAQNTATTANNKANSNASAITTLQSAVSTLQSKVTALETAKHVISTTTSGNWTIDEYNTGWVQMRYKGSVTFNAAGSLLNGWYRSVQNVTLPVQIHTTGASCYGSGAANARLFVVAGLSSGTAVECQLLSGASLAAGLSVSNADIIVEGNKA